MGAEKLMKVGFVLSATDKMSRVIDEAVKKSTSKLTALERKANAVGASMRNIGKWSLGAGAAIGAALVGAAKVTANAGDSAIKTAQKVGMSAEEWQKLAYAANFSNVSQEELVSHLTRLNKKLVDTKAGVKGAGDVFKDLGIKLGTPQEVLEQLSDIFARVKDGPEKASLAMELFGKSGASIIPFLNAGGKGIRALGKEAEDTGNVLSNDLCKSSETFNDLLGKLVLQGKGLTYQLGAALIPKFISLFEKASANIQRFKDWIDRNKELVAGIAKWGMILSGVLLTLGAFSMTMGILISFTTRAMAITKGIAAAFKVFNLVLLEAKTGMLLFRIQYGALVVWQKLAAAAQWLFNAALFGCPVVWIIAAIIAIGAAVYLLIKHWDKVKEFFAKLWDGVKAVFSAVWEWLKNLFLNYTPHGLIIKHWDKISAWFAKLWDGVKAVFSVVWEWIKNMFLNYTPQGLIIKHWDKISAWFSKLWDGVKAVFSAVWEWIKNMFLNYTPQGLIIKHWDNLPQWFAALWENVKGVFLSLGEFFTGLKDKFYNWGRDLITGLIDGVKSMISNAMNSVSELGSKISGKFKSLLGIASPSKVFAEFGVNITRGLVGGIERSEDDAAQASGSLAMQTMRGMSAASNSVSNNNYSQGGGVTVNYSPSMTVTGATAPETEQNFRAMLKRHSAEIERIVNAAMQQRNRLSFAD